MLVVDGASKDPWEVLFDPVADELCDLSSKREEGRGKLFHYCSGLNSLVTLGLISGLVAFLTDAELMRLTPRHDDCSGGQ